MLEQIRTTKKEFDYINFLRFLATLMVFGLHTSIFSGELGFEFSEKTWFLKTPAWGGVWVFFILSGYLAGKGFKEKRYEMTIKGIARFYWVKFVKIFIPVLIFNLGVLLFVFPEFMNDNIKELVGSFFALSYNGNPGVNGVGATWYIYSLCRLYIIAPIVFCIYEFVIKRLNSDRVKGVIAVALIILIAVAGAYYRSHALFEWGCDWYSMVYTPFYANLDLFLCGMLFNEVELPTFRYRPWMGIVLCVLSVIPVIINIRLYYFERVDLYQAYFPTVYLVLGVGLVVFKAMDIDMVADSENLVRFTINRFINWFATISLGFYLFHSLVLDRLKLVTCLFSNIGPNHIHARMLLIAFFISVIMGVLFKQLCSTVSNCVKRK